jgi:hypothetical protein
VRIAGVAGKSVRLLGGHKAAGPQSGGRLLVRLKYDVKNFLI